MLWRERCDASARRPPARAAVWAVSGALDVILGAYRLDQAIDKRIGTPLPRSHLGKDRDRDEERTSETEFEQFKIRDKQIRVGGQRADAAAIEQEVAARTAGHSGQVSARR